MDEALKMIEEMVDAFQAETKNYPTWQLKRQAMLHAQAVRDRALAFLKQHKHTDEKDT